VTKKIETVTNDTYITSIQVVELLEKLAINYVGKPIAIVLDNASYQRCKFVTDKAIELGITLMFLPSYSPNLNLIERAWKFVKSEVLNAVYIDTFDEYCNRISRFVNYIESENLEKMDKLITENFQTFSNCRIR
jgi:transposase